MIHEMKGNEFIKNQKLNYHVQMSISKIRRQLIDGVE